MPFYSAQVTLKMTSGVTADECVNTFHFSGSNTATDPGIIADELDVLYDDLRTIYSSDVARTGHTIKVYNLDDVKPRVPVLEQTYDFTVDPAGNPLPHEVAVVSSFQAVRVSGINQARRRGRVYLGPLDVNTVATNGFVHTTTITTIRNAFIAFNIAMGATAVVWMVYSPTAGDGFGIANGWINNEFDTQRRRGKLATTRNVWP